MERPPPPEDRVGVLATADLLADASPADIAALASSAEWLRVDAGTELFAAGDTADGLYLLLRGRVECHVNGALIGEIGRGGTLGEIASLSGTPRTASARTARDSLLVRIPPGELPQLARRSPSLALELARLAARRASTAPPAALPAAPPRSIGVVALDGSGTAAELAEAVSARLGGQVDVRLVTREQLAAYHERGADSVAGHLATMEDSCDLLVMSCALGRGQEVDEVTVAVLRQTDLIVGVAASRGTPDERTLTALRRVGRPVFLALVRTAGQEPSRTARWLHAVVRHAEVRSRIQLLDGDAGDLDRLARALIGQSIGVVLGGGGARGFAHVGVLRALREAGLPIDLVGGSSMGAVIGAQFALGMTPEEMLAANTAGWSRRRLLDFGLPTLSLLRGRGATKVIDGFFASTQIEDLPLDFFCTTVDLSDFKLHVARHGDVAAWVRASASVPGLWPPVVDVAGHLHVDGGLLNNVPTDVMRAGRAGTVIGVDVCRRQSEMRVPAAVRSLPTGLALVRARCGGQWFPSILDVLNRANLLASLQHQQHSHVFADMLITPPVEDEGFAAFDRIEKLAEIGYRAAAQVIEVQGLPVF